MPTLAENVCKAVGHNWDYERVCDRCRVRQVVQVFVDGILLAEGNDYYVYNDTVHLNSPVPLTANIQIFKWFANESMKIIRTTGVNIIGI